jgi:hypothetical protein
VTSFAQPRRDRHGATTPWLVALSVSSWRREDGCGTSIATLNSDTVQRVAAFVAEQDLSSVSFASQQITNRDRDSFLCSIEADVDGVRVQRSDGVELSDASFLRTFLDDANQRTNAERAILWLISHGRTERHLLRNGARSTELDVVVTTPTQMAPKRADPRVRSRQEFSRSVMETAARATADALDVPRRVQIASPAYGRALGNSSDRLAVLLLQSCGAGGLDLVAQLATHRACQRLVASPFDVPPPAEEHQGWLAPICREPTRATDAVARDMVDALTALPETSHTLDGWPPSPRAGWFSANLAAFDEFHQCFSDALGRVRAALDGDSARALREAWDVLAVSGREGRRRTTLARVLGWLSSSGMLTESQCSALASTHDALFDYASVDHEHVRASATVPCYAPLYGATDDVFEQCGWYALLRSIGRSSP